MQYILALVIIGICFLGLGLGIMFFGKKKLKTECSANPGEDCSCKTVVNEAGEEESVCEHEESC